MSIKLTEGCLERIMEGAEIPNPVFQVLGIKKIQTGSSNKERYRLVVSDGVYSYSKAMLGSANSEDVLRAGEHTVIRAKRYMATVVNNTQPTSDQRILILLDVDIVASGKDVNQPIGNPIQLSEAKKNEASKATAQKQNNNAMMSRPSNVTNSTFSSSGVSGVGGLEDQMIHPISSLSPYQNKWIIKARVTNKSAIRTWSNSRGEGQLFSMDLVDESGEIRCTAFKEMVDKYYKDIEVDKIYFITKCQLKPANKQYSTLKNDYEMTMTSETIVQESQSDDRGIPKTKYNFTTIDKIANTEVGALIDVCAICKDTSDLQTFQAKSTGRELKKKEIVLVDQSNTAVSLTLWGNDAENFNGTNNPVVVVKGAKVGEFGGGKNLSCLSSSQMKINPDIDESFRIRGWYDQEGCKGNITDISARSGTASFNTPWMSFREVKDQGLGNGDKGDYYQTMGTILLMRSENMFYRACPAESCNKKIVDLENGTYRCEKCNREYTDYKYRLLCSMNVGDWSGNTWMSMFTSEAETILGMTAKEVGELIENNAGASSSLVEKVNFKQFVFKCRAKMETYNDEARLKTIAIDVKPINYKEYNTQMINRIKHLMG